MGYAYYCDHRGCEEGFEMPTAWAVLNDYVDCPAGHRQRKDFRADLFQDMAYRLETLEEDVKTLKETLK